MSDLLKVGRRVDVTAKGVQGVIAFVGKTNFATGTWIGVVLDEPKGKNNGSLRGQQYFKCEDNYGVFVRESQVVPLDEKGKPIETTSEDQVPSKIARSRQSTPGSKPKPTTSRMSLASSRQSLAGSRQSLTGSRQSLSGSRSHLASPSTEKPAEGAELAKTLKPQFTPGQAMTTTPTPITSVEEKINNLQLQQELENRSQQIRDLGEKLETLKLKRQEDKEKLKDYDKLKIQLEQLIEFKSKIMEAQASLQRELQRAKQEAKEAIEARETHAEEVADLAEAVEMATLDKEMAEEKAETLQLELEFCKERLEEVTLDLEILKAEMQEKSSGSASAANEDQLSAYEIKQLQQQNARLRETLVRLRDLSAHEKHEYQKLLKDIDQKKSEITELGKTKEKLSARVEDMEQQIADLQEQVDAALGAEEMVVILGEQKLTLEEKVAQLQEEVTELEALQDMNDQLVESNAELEADLREELDMAQAATREAMRDRDAALETIADREQTISKFRQLVQQLQEQSLDLQHRLEKETSKPVSALPEIMDFKKMFTETKAHTKAIDLELRRVDIQQLQQHIKYLTSYMPDSFMNRGGDHDAVLVLLLIPRLIHKTEILLSQIKDKFPNVEKVDRSAISKGHSVEQFAFKCRMSFYIFALQTILHQYYYALNTCKPNALLKVGATYPEMAAQEKVIDGFVELVKRDQLDENVPTEALEKSVGYFNTLFPVLLGSDIKINHTQLLGDNVKCLLAVADGFTVDATVIRCLIETANVGDVGLLAQHIITTSEQLQQQLKLVKRRLPMDTSVSNLGLNKEVSENLYQCYQHSGKIQKTLHDIVKTTVQTLTTNGAVNASDKVYEQDDLGPVQSIKNSLSFILTQVTQVAQFLQDNEYEISTANRNEEKPVAPIQIRSDSVKKELEQTKTLTRSQLSSLQSIGPSLPAVVKDSPLLLQEIDNLRKLFHQERNERIKLQNAKLKEQLDSLAPLPSFKNTHDEVIETLFKEGAALKQGAMPSIATSSKIQKVLFISDDDANSADSEKREQNIGETSKKKVQFMPDVTKHVSIVGTSSESDRLGEEEIPKKRRKPLPRYFGDCSSDDMKSPRRAKRSWAIATKTISQLKARVRKFRRENYILKSRVDKEKEKMLSLKRRSEAFQSKVAAERVKRKYGGKIETDFTIFPTKEMVKAMNASKSVNIGFVKIASEYLPPTEKPGIINLELDFENLQKILQSLIN
ncbi:hypothetical protein NQ314_015159 [Rhamnusium bicolor]|uniref:Dynactin subunit 1 n=1 Tax=Rhamnusium bicolor TaxID=1586634 RepID=A0AAV8X074_9CUCU|nr:hypothetical protein NQ314_015159 [Rhamnusium bicolor]